MSNIDIDYDNHKVSLSLGIEFLHLSVLNTISYDLYALDINHMIFNDKRITFQNLFNLIVAGLKRTDKTISVELETYSKTMNFKLNVNNDYTTFIHTFELIKQENGNTDLKEIKKNLVLLNKNLSPLEKIWERASNIFNIDKYSSVISCLEREMNEEVIKGFKISEGNKKYYFEIKSKLLITLLDKYKGSQICTGNYPLDGSKSLNLIWDSHPGSGTTANNSSLRFTDYKIYELEKDFRIILNYKKINIIYHETDNKWWITFLYLPYMG
jgi:hypothetical protein